VRSDLAERLGKTLREVKAAPLPSPGDLAMKVRPPQREKTSANFIERLRGLAVATPSHFLALRLKWVERFIKAWREGCRVFYGILHRFGGHRVIGPS
jgi:hypothetical protein